MLKTLYILLIICVPIIGSAQNSVVQQLFDKYSGQEGFTSVHISSYMFELFSKIESEDKELKEITKNLESIKILAMDSMANKKRGMESYRELAHAFEGSEYKDLMVIRDGAEEVKFLIKDENDKIRELVMLVGGNDDLVLIFLEGNIDLKQISKLSKSMNIDGFEHLDKVADKKN